MGRGGWAAVVATGAFQGQGSVLVEVCKWGASSVQNPPNGLLPLGQWAWALVNLPCMPLSFWALFYLGNPIPIFCL